MINSQIIQKSKSKFLFFLLSLAVIVLSSTSGMASSTRPNLQEMHAQRELEINKMQKQQQVAIFKKQRDELLVNYKLLANTRDEVYQVMKSAERDYKTALAKVKNSQQQLSEIDKQMSLLRKNNAQTEKNVLLKQIQKVQESQDKLAGDMQKYSRIQQDSYSRMISADSQYRNFVAKEQILKQQIDSVQRQLQFVISQP